MLLRHTPNRIPFSQQAEIVGILEEAEKLGNECLRRTIGVLVSSVHPMFYSGVGNQQPPVMVDLKTKAEEALGDTHLHPLMRRLFESIRASASIDIRPFPEEEFEEEF